MNDDPDNKQLAPLHQRFSAAWSQLGAQPVPSFAALSQRYNEPHRAYHTLEHIAACVGWLAVSRDFAEHPFEVELALFYHDVVHYPLCTDNEQRSAEWFRFEAKASQLPEASVRRIAALIEGTATHHARGGDAALVNDIDLAILGAPPHAFARYEQQIQAEYAHPNEALFRAGRERVLRSFLERLSTYSTPFFSQRLEAQARTNLYRSLSVLHQLSRTGTVL